METRTPSSPPADDGTVAVVAATLQEAYRRVKKEYGDDAVILGSRTRARRQALGLGTEREVEVRVQPAGTRRAPASAQPPAATGDMAAAVARIEDLVAALEAAQADLARPAPAADGPEAAALVAAGAGAATVEHLLARCAAETGGPPAGRRALQAWLGRNLPASNAAWEGFAGCHAFMGRSGAGCTDLVLTTARALQARGRRTLVLSILPAHRGEVRRLQTAAAAGSFDAAVIQKPESIPAAADHLGDYGAVLLDLPDLDAPAMAQDGALHAWLAGHEGFHRHLVLPLDGDPRDLAALAPRARAWNCDWLALGHTGRSRLWGKVLDLQRDFGLPLSLLASEAPGGEPSLAASASLLDRVLGADEDPAAPVTARA